MTLDKILACSGGGLFLLLTLVELAPIKVNPWSWIAKSIGKAMGIEAIEEVNQKLNAPAGPFKAYQGQVNADDGLNCRTAPVSGSVLKTYPDGTVLTITKEEGSWGYCGQGWVCLDYINKIASANDAETKEESIMNGKLFKKMYDEINPTYNTLDEIPSYWRDDIQELVDKGIISGSGNGKLGLTHSDCKAAVLAKRIREKL